MTPERCHDCAFRPGTQPSQSVNTVLKAKLCVIAREPFYCHVIPPDSTGAKPLCRGFVDAVEATMGKPQPEWRRRVAAELSDVVTEFEDAWNANQDYDLRAAVLAAVERVVDEP